MVARSSAVSRTLRSTRPACDATCASRLSSAAETGSSRGLTRVSAPSSSSRVPDLGGPLAAPERPAARPPVRARVSERAAASPAAIPAGQLDLGAQLRHRPGPRPRTRVAPGGPAEQRGHPVRAPPWRRAAPPCPPRSRRAPGRAWPAARRPGGWPAAAPAPRAGWNSTAIADRRRDREQRAADVAGGRADADARWPRRRRSARRRAGAYLTVLLMMTSIWYSRYFRIASVTTAGTTASGMTADTASEGDDQRVAARAARWPCP